MAPLLKVAFWSGTTRSASIRCSTPKPPQAGQAPNGLLNENSRGSISGRLNPDTGQANLSEKTMRCPLPAARRPADERDGADGGGASASAAIAIPSASLRAVSKDPARRAAG